MELHLQNKMALARAKTVYTYECIHTSHCNRDVVGYRGTHQTVMATVPSGDTAGLRGNAGW